MRPGAEEERTEREERPAVWGPDRRLALFQCNYGACVCERRVQERSGRDRRKREREAQRKSEKRKRVGGKN